MYTQDDTYMHMYKIVCEYYNGALSLKEAENMACDEFMLTYRNAIVDKLMQTEEGRTDIKRYYRLSMQDEEESKDESALSILFGDKVEIKKEQG